MPRIPVVNTFEIITLAKATGTAGLRIITATPLTFVGATYLGGLFCGYFVAIAGDNFVGTIFNGSSWALTRLMRGVEIVLNSIIIILQPLSNFT